MIFKKYDNIYCIRLIHQENFLEMLEKFAKVNNLENAIILNGVGMLKNAEIGYFDSEKYITKTISEPAELVSTNGNMFINPEGMPEWHIHVALAQRTHKMVGGHLLKGIVCNTAEIFIRTIPDAKFVKEIEDDNLRLNFK
ncbi:MAG: PPC domain-containing DNA-binding protein [Candidatus Cloacimonadota bacterium]|nr:PPC domain-containing DNA-binding protein [Candidatus Cloacimonadota bacterium]